MSQKSQPSAEPEATALLSPAAAWPPRLASIQALRAVAAWLVVLYHLAETPDDRWSQLAGQTNWLHYYRVIGFAGVDLFFVISGVVMMVTCYHRFGRPRESLRFLARRAARVYPLYWFCTLVLLVVFALKPSLATTDRFTLVLIAKSLLLWPQDEFPVVAVGWTLVFEMFFYVVFAVLLTLRRRPASLACAGWAALTLVLYLWLDRPEWHCLTGNLHLPIYASPLVLEFLAGVGIGVLFCRQGERSEDKQAPQTVRKCWRLPLLSLLLGVLSLLTLGYAAGQANPDEVQYGLVRVAIFGSASVMIVYGATALERANRWPALKGMVFWGNASYALYLTHVYVIRLMAKFQAKLNPDLTSNTQLLWIMAILLACGAVAAASHLWIERPLAAIARRALADPPLGGRTGDL